MRLFQIYQRTDIQTDIQTSRSQYFARLLLRSNDLVVGELVWATINNTASSAGDVLMHAIFGCLGDLIHPHVGRSTLYTCSAANAEFD